MPIPSHVQHKAHSIQYDVIDTHKANEKQNKYSNSAKSTKV